MSMILNIEATLKDLSSTAKIDLEDDINHVLGKYITSYESLKVSLYDEFLTDIKEGQILKLKVDKGNCYYVVVLYINDDRYELSNGMTLWLPDDYHQIDVKSSKAMTNLKLQTLVDLSILHKEYLNVGLNNEANPSYLKFYKSSLDHDYDVHRVLVDRGYLKMSTINNLSDVLTILYTSKGYGPGKYEIPRLEADSLGRLCDSLLGGELSDI